MFCDVSLGFKTLRGKCIRVKTQNCAISNFEGFCLSCKDGYYLDPYTLKCIEVLQAGTVLNCKQYMADNTCSVCDPDFGLTIENKCIPVPNRIDGCEVYKTKDFCAVCSSELLLSMDYKSCIKPKPETECANYSQLKCVECASGFIYNRNNFVYEQLSFTNKLNVHMLENRLVEDQGVTHFTRLNTCQRLTVPNCSVHATFNECLTCSSGYFLEEGRCTAYPKERILNCVKY